MEDLMGVTVDLLPDHELEEQDGVDLDRVLYDLDCQLEWLSSQADTLDYLLSISSGLLCGALDVLWTGMFSLERGRGFASDAVDGFVQKTARLLGCEADGMKSAVRFLERRFPIPSDGNTGDFGGGSQHHLRDFAHHPTLAGLAFSLLTQFSGKAYGTDQEGKFRVVDVPEKSRIFLGKDTPTKILYGTLIWMGHLVSDVAGSSGCAGESGGTGLPGPILALAKELSVLPLVRDLQVGENSLSVFLLKLFDGTLLARRGPSGAIQKDGRFDLRGELGVGAEQGRQALPVLANECIVRVFYWIRHLAMEVREKEIHSLDEMKQISWESVRPVGNPTVDRMLVIAAGVFTTVDVGEALLAQGGRCWVAVNYAGVGRFALAIRQDVAWCLKARDLQRIKAMYEEIKRFAFMREDGRRYERIGSDWMDTNKFGLTAAQTELLYNVEYYKVHNDIQRTKLPIQRGRVETLKQAWLDEWKEYMTKGFSGFLQVEDAELHWYSEEELHQRIAEHDPSGLWFRLILLEGMLFEPYYPLSLEKDKRGVDVPSKKYKDLQNPVFGYQKEDGDRYLELFFAKRHHQEGYIKRLRRCYDKVFRELNEVLKTVVASLSITAVIAIAAVATAGAFAPAIAVALVGSNFAGLSGAALTSACLAYLGGGAVAVGGLGMAGGTIAVVGGGAVLGLGVGAGVGGAVGAAGLAGKKTTILQSAKLIVSMREIFLNDEHDLAYSNYVYEEYVKNIEEIEKGLVELRLKADVARGEEKKQLKDKIKKAEEMVEAMKTARKSMDKFVRAFEAGMNAARGIDAR